MTLLQKPGLIILGLVGLLFMGSCRVDHAADLTKLRESMAPAEVLFYREYEPDIEEGNNLLHISHQAAFLGYLATITTIHTKHMDINLADEFGWTPLMRAAEGGHLSVVRYLVEKAGSDVRTRTEKRVTALMLAIINNHPDVTAYLLDRGANVNAKTNQGSTPLMMAAAVGNLALVELLIERGASVDLTDGGGNSALDYAATEAIKTYVSGLSRARKTDQ